MGDGQHGRARLGDPCEEQSEDRGLGVGVEVAGRLVGQHQLRPGDQRGAERDALPLALAKCPGPPVELAREPAGLGQTFGPRAQISVEPHIRADTGGIENVLAGAEMVEQREILEDEPDRGRAELAAFRVAQVRDH